MSNAIQTVVSDELPAALGPYSHAVKAGGFAFLSGNIPITKAGDVVPGGAAEQTDQVCKNITLALKACGTELPKVVKVNIFLADMGDFAAVNEVYGKYFAHKPARSCVAVKELPKKVLVEIECIAAL
ncbi:uncharacterized protein E0L32_008906 [Thyridium curvatum]|uniref:Uncharacterized protein n=1 Tax=Thyridium curvatum TaxID=1093900 RepID=A0A507ATR2_9PEZI|nr:uncharacterized protein E0L32_008906 [Thyridium curvatum]TPX09884.1 hypothetical protein E0L32_008906 [Thyridium curvatum]